MQFACTGHPDIAAKEIDAEYYLNEDTALPQVVMEWAGIEDNECRGPGCKISIKGQTYPNLAVANDKGVKFKHIAKWIEQNYKLL